MAAVADPQSLIKAVEERQPDAVLTDIRMPPTFTTEGIDATKRIRAEHPSIGVVVLSQYAQEEDAVSLLQDGSADWATCSRSGVPGRRAGPSAARRRPRRLRPGPEGGGGAPGTAFGRGAPGPLTDREREVLQEKATGSTNATIARTLFRSERAVEKRIGSVFQKLGLTDEGEINRRVKAVLTFLEAAGPDR